MDRITTLEYYDKVLKLARNKGTVDQVMRQLATTDLFFLNTQIMHREFMNCDWFFDRLREIQADPNGNLDLWARGHGKTTCISQGLTIFDVLRNPEITICIMSFNTQAATDIFKVVKDEFEDNELLHALFPDILYENPSRQSKMWNEAGIKVKRKTNRSEPTVAPWGLVDKPPTGKHYDILVFDDIITPTHVKTPTQLQNANNAWQQAMFVVSKEAKYRYVGTRYSHNDTYSLILKGGRIKPRIHTATKDNTVDGELVYLDKDQYDDFRAQLNIYQLMTQLFQDPSINDKVGFHITDLRFVNRIDYSKMNLYILVDPASGKTNRSDYTAMMVVGIGADGNYYIVDMVRDKLNLSEKADTLFRLVRKYGDYLKGVGYEKYSMQSDIEYIKERMSYSTFHFEIQELGSKVSKDKRIEWLEPIIKEHKLYLPVELSYDSIFEGRVDLVRTFCDEEISMYPFGSHDDMLDCLSRIKDPDLRIEFPGRVLNTNGFNHGISDNGARYIGKRMIDDGFNHNDDFNRPRRIFR